MPRPQRVPKQFRAIQEERSKFEKRQKDGKEDSDTMYVDKYRGIAVMLEGEGKDLKGDVKSGGPGERPFGAPDQYVYLRQAEYFLKKGKSQEALLLLNFALELAPDSLEVLATRSRCNLQLGNWEAAYRDAEMVLRRNPYYVKAIYGKAESLFNMCNFEHALLCFHNGQALCPDNDEFKMGIIKSRKTIMSSLPPDVFKLQGARGVLAKMQMKLKRNPAIEGDMAPAEAAPKPAGFISLGNITSALQQKQKKKIKQKSNNRLKADYEFLSTLSSQMDVSGGDEFTADQDNVARIVHKAAKDGMEFIMSREQFWNSIK